MKENIAKWGNSNEKLFNRPSARQIDPKMMGTLADFINICGIFLNYFFFNSKSEDLKEEEDLYEVLQTFHDESEHEGTNVGT